MRLSYCCYCKFMWQYIFLGGLGLGKVRIGMVLEVWNGKNRGASRGAEQGFAYLHMHIDL